MEVRQLSQLGLRKSDLIVVFDYLFRKITIKEFKSHFPDSLSVKRRIDKCGYMLLNCKLFAYAHHVAIRDSTRKPNPRNFGVDLQDARFLRRMDLSHVPKKFRAHTLKDFQESLSTFLTSPDLNNLLGKFISKKMRFMIKSYGDTRDDLQMSMRVAAMYNIYRVYPYFESYLHMCNVGKGAAAKHGHSLIKQRTTLKNQRLTSNSDGTHSSRIVPLEAVHHVLSTEEYVDISVELIETIMTRCTPRVQHFFHLLSGNFDSEFSLFLGQDNKLAALEMRFDVYQSHVQRYLGVTPAQVRGLYGKLRNRYIKNSRLLIE